MNKMQKKIMVVSTGRADYGLLYPLIKKIIKSRHLKLQLIVTGTHLSAMHGNTINFIEKDNSVKITGKVKITAKGDTENMICTSIATGLTKFSKIIEKHNPHILVVLGDRYELWSICMAGVVHKVPIAHIHGGETSFGAIDETIRHSVTKMSAFHFASMDLYAKRIIQMGENPSRVFVVGAIGLDNIAAMDLMTLKELLEYTGLDFQQKTALMTYHPVTLDNYNSSEYQTKEILNALLETDLITLMTMPNADTSGSLIYQQMKKYTAKYPEKFRLIKNLGQKAYLSAMKYSQLMIGNSSSGIIESASFKLPVVNIGDRQAGRFKPANIIDCVCEKEKIKKAVQWAMSNAFRKSVENLVSPYGDGKASMRIVNILESIDMDKKSQILKKKFYDLKNIQLT